MKIVIDIEDSCVKYHLELDRRINFIVGDSGTGKTTIVDLLENKARDISIISSCNLNYLIANITSWDILLAGAKDSLIIFDDLEVVSTPLFASLVKKYCIQNNLYFLIMCRDDSDSLSTGDVFSASSIFKLVTENGVHLLKPYYNFEINDCYDIDLCIVEDSASGYTFYSNLFKDIDVISSSGKGNITKYVKKYSDLGYKNILVIFDNASFGCHMEEYYNKLYNLESNIISISNYECFEELLIQSNIINHLDEVKEVLSNLPKYANDCISWETYFEDFLLKVTENKQYIQRHGKNSRLNDCYFVDCGRKGKNEDGYVCRNLCDIFLEGNKLEEMLKGTKYECLLKFKKQ